MGMGGDPREGSQAVVEEQRFDHLAVDRLPSQQAQAAIAEAEEQRQEQMMIEIEIEAVERFERARAQAQEAQQQLRQSMARQLQKYVADNGPTCMHTASRWTQAQLPLDLCLRLTKHLM